jgi:hypothetical protein
MGRRSGFQRAPDDFRPGKVIAWDADPVARRRIAERATYRGNGEHKSYPAPSGEWIPSLRRGKALCWRFDVTDWPRLQDLLRRAIAAGFVHEEFRGDFPVRAWAYINGILHEARLHNETLGEYHAFPIEYPEQIPDDPDGFLKKAPHEQITVH